MANEVIKVDVNARQVAAGVTDDGNLDVVQLRVNPSTKRLEVDATVTSSTAPTSISHNKTSVTTAGTRVQMPTFACQSVTVKALVANTGLIYIGGSTVSSTNGFQLSAGDSVSMDISNVNVLYIDSSVNGEGVSWIANA